MHGNDYNLEIREHTKYFIDKNERSVDCPRPIPDDKMGIHLLCDFGNVTRYISRSKTFEPI